jgi:phage tail sheath protein FI
VHQFAEYEDKVNRPLLISSFKEAQTAAGYIDSSWGDFTLCEAIYAHFRNNVQMIGPIILINVLDPDVHMAQELATATVTLTNGMGYLNNPYAILKTIKIAGKVLGVDYSAEYLPDGTRVLIKDLNNSLGSSIAVSFNVIDPAAVTDLDLIGGTSASGERSGIAVLDLVYQTFNMVPTLLAAPYWSTIPAVDTALKSASQKINGHWYAFVNSDISSTATGASTIAEAKAAKVDKGYVSSLEAPCWPMGKNGEDKVFHLSTIATVTMQWVDFNRNGVPVETPSNKPIDIKCLCLADGTQIDFDQVQANDLNSKGIRTATYWGGRWVLWGGHTGEYEYGKDMDKRNVFDSSVRMLQYIANTFQSRYGILVDKPFNRALKDTILNDLQEWLDNLISQGSLLIGTIVFEESSNPVSDMVEGDFVFDIATTTTPPGKSLTAKITYTSSGLDVLFGGAE